jgi:hypothetical protein
MNARISPPARVCVSDNPSIGTALLAIASGRALSFPFWVIFGNHLLPPSWPPMATAYGYLFALKQCLEAPPSVSALGHARPHLEANEIWKVSLSRHSAVRNWPLSGDYVNLQ